jgi:hypothetical protein
VEKFGWAGTYAWLGAAGLATLITGAPATREVLGTVWVTLLALFVIVGAGLAIYGAYKDYRFEMSGILSVGVGAAMYSAALWYLAAVSPNVPIHTALFITAVSWACLMRFLWINHVRHRLYKAIDANESLEQDGF